MKTYDIIRENEIDMILGNEKYDQCLQNCTNVHGDSDPSLALCDTQCNQWLSNVENIKKESVQPSPEKKESPTPSKKPNTTPDPTNEKKVDAQKETKETKDTSTASSDKKDTKKTSKKEKKIKAEKSRSSFLDNVGKVKTKSGISGLLFRKTGGTGYKYSTGLQVFLYLTLGIFGLVTVFGGLDNYFGDDGIFNYSSEEILIIGICLGITAISIIGNVIFMAQLESVGGTSYASAQKKYNWIVIATFLIISIFIIIDEATGIHWLNFGIYSYALSAFLIIFTLTILTKNEEQFLWISGAGLILLIWLDVFDVGNRGNKIFFSVLLAIVIAVAIFDTPLPVFYIACIGIMIVVIFEWIFVIENNVQRYSIIIISGIIIASLMQTAVSISKNKNKISYYNQNNTCIVFDVSKKDCEELGGELIDGSCIVPTMTELECTNVYKKIGDEI